MTSEERRLLLRNGGGGSRNFDVVSSTSGAAGDRFDGPVKDWLWISRGDGISGEDCGDGEADDTGRNMERNGEVCVDDDDEELVVMPVWERSGELFDESSAEPLLVQQSSSAKGNSAVGSDSIGAAGDDTAEDSDRELVSSCVRYCFNDCNDG